MTKTIFSLVYLLSLSLKTICQETEFPEMGKFSNEELTMTECSFDKDAVAVILLNAAIADHDDDNHLITKHRVRIKILSDKGTEYANRFILYYSKDDFEKIYDLEATVYNVDAGIISLNRSQIFKEVINDRISRLSFAMPAVKKGSIIEYQYTNEMRHYGGLGDWYFQDDIPTLKSCYLLTLPPNTEFSYVITKKKEYPIKIVPNRIKGNVFFEMDNIPGFVPEPFMNASKKYYSQKVAFKLSSYKSPYWGLVKVNDTWDGLAKELDRDIELGGSIKKDLPGTDAIKALIATETTQSGKLKKIYEYVQSNFTWNKIDTWFAPDNLKKVMEKKVGTSGELNLLLVNLLNIFNIEAYPMLVAERNVGKVAIDFPSADQFNKAVAYATADGKDYILDATEKYCPVQLIPSPILNTDALIVNKRTKGLVHINSGNRAFFSNVTITSQLDKNGMLTGKTGIEAKDYALQYFLQQLRTDEKKFINDYLLNQNEGVSIKNFNTVLSNAGNDTLQFQFDFQKNLDDNSDFILFNYNLFTGQTKNPFLREIRFSDINFEYPYVITVHHQLTVPAETKMDLPENKTIATPSNDITVSRRLELKGNILDIWTTFRRSTAFYSVLNYTNLREFYIDMLKLLNEPVVIKLKK